MGKNILLSSIVALAFLVAGSSMGPQARGDGRESEPPQITLEREVFDDFPLLNATVTRDDEPLEEVTVRFSVERQFGLLELGTDVTWGDGTASVDFPEGLPGDDEGLLRIVAEIIEPEEYAEATTRALLEGGIPRHAVDEPLQRALWAPQAPVPLLLSIGGALLVVWTLYAYAVAQLFKIRKEKRICCTDTEKNT